MQRKKRDRLPGYLKRKTKNNNSVNGKGIKQKAQSSNQELESTCFQEYDHYKEYRDILNEGEQKVSEGLDKAILAISSAALGLTFTFGKSVWGSDALIGVLWLKASWLLLGISLFLVIASLANSGIIYYINRKKYDLLMYNRSEIISCLRSKSESIPDKIEFSEYSYLRILNNLFHFSAPVFLIAGIMSIGIFFNVNIGNSENESKTSSTTDANTISARLPREENLSATSASSTKKTNTNGKLGNKTMQTVKHIVNEL